MQRVLLMVLALLCCTPAQALDAEELHTAEARALALIELQPPHWEEALAEFRRAAEAGSARAMSYVGWMHEQGHGVARDKAEAARWYARAAEAGAHDFAIKLGWMHLAGDGVEASRARSEQWFQRAIDAGHDPARIALASVIIADALGGESTERVGEARALLERALAGGQRLAAFFLARLYVEGIGGHATDDALGAHYARISAEDGQPQMQGWLAMMHLEGAGVPQDRDEAAFWAALAAAGEDPLGRRLHAMLGEQMNDEQRRALMERTLRWSLERQGG